MFTVIIPGRYASTRLPGKPLADIRAKVDVIVPVLWNKQSVQVLNACHCWVTEM